MRKKIVAGNWKMNGDHSSSKSLYNDLAVASDSFPSNVEVMVAPAFVFLNELNQEENKKVKVIAQNCADNESGAFTGEVSPLMLKSIGINSVIVGHSERRHIYGESIRDISEKVVLLLKHNMQVIFCIGEQLTDRKSNNHFQIIEDQLQSIMSLQPALLEKIVIAYEPV